MLERLRDDLGASGLLPRLLELFSTRTPARLEALQLDVAGGDAARVCNLAHTLKGSAQTLAAQRLATLCQSLEERARRGRWRMPGPYWRRSKRRSHEARDALEAELADAR